VERLVRPALRAILEAMGGIEAAILMIDADLDEDS
jgi:hypothetical protein